MSLRIVVDLLSAALSAALPAALSLVALGGLPSLLPLETAANSYIIADRIFAFIQSAKNGDWRPAMRQTVMSLPD